MKTHSVYELRQSMKVCVCLVRNFKKHIFSELDTNVALSWVMQGETTISEPIIWLPSWDPVPQQ